MLDVVSDSDVVMCAKVILTKNFSINNYGVPILTLELWKKQSKCTRNMKYINFVPKDVQRILSLHKKFGKV